MRRYTLVLSSILLICMVISAKPRKLTSTLKWDFTPDGTLVISGNGAMPDWPAPQSQAWYKEGLWPKVNNIIIEEGVTSIGFKSFSPVGDKYKRSTPVSLYLPSTLREIGDFSFKSTRIKDLTLNDGVVRIGLGAFTGSLAQDSLVFPHSLLDIADGAFMRCDIGKVIFQSDVTVAPGAFFECKSLNSIDFNDTWATLGPGAFEGNHKLNDLLHSDNIRTPNGNPFIRTPLERNPEVLALIGGPASANQPAEQVVIENVTDVPVYKSELDYKIPIMDGINRDRTFALVIGNEKYTREASVPYAVNDAEIFGRYLKKTLGIPAKNVNIIKNASLNDMRFGLNLLAKTSNAFDGDINIIIYYAGHGVPDESSREAYLLPIDGYGADPSTGYSINALYERLNNIPSKSTIVFLDACFSGTKREGDMMASARGVAIAPRKTQPVSNAIVFTAASGDETAYAYNEEGHGMFTYFLLKKLNESMGDVSLGELADYIITNVRQTAIRENHKPQTPTVTAPAEAGEEWRNIKL